MAAEAEAGTGMGDSDCYGGCGVCVLVWRRVPDGGSRTDEGDRG